MNFMIELAFENFVIRVGEENDIIAEHW